MSVTDVKEILRFIIRYIEELNLNEVDLTMCVKLHVEGKRLPFSQGAKPRSDMSTLIYFLLPTTIYGLFNFVDVEVVYNHFYYRNNIEHMLPFDYNIVHIQVTSLYDLLL